MKNRTILCFDVDGVIINNSNIGFEKMKDIAVKLGGRPVSDDFLRQHWGKHTNDLILAICQESGIAEDLYESFKGINMALHEEVSMDNDLLGALVSLPQFGFATAVITSRDQCLLDNCFKKVGLSTEIFDYVQTADDHHVCKPDGSVFLPLLQWAHNIGSFTAEHIVYFGDTVAYDYQAVKNARLQGQSIKFIGVCSGVNTAEDFQAAGLAEDEIITSHECLSSFLEQLILERYQDKSQKILSRLLPKQKGAQNERFVKRIKQDNYPP